MRLFRDPRATERWIQQNEKWPENAGWKTEERDGGVAGAAESLSAIEEDTEGCRGRLEWREKVREEMAG